MAVRGHGRLRRFAVLLALAAVLAEALVAQPSAEAATSTRFSLFVPPDHNDYAGPIAVGTQRWYCDPLERHFVVTDRANRVLHTWPTPHANNCRAVGNDHEAVVAAENQLGLLVVSAADGTVSEVDPPADQLTGLAFRYATLLFMSGERVLASVPTESTNHAQLVVIDLTDGNVTELKGFASSPYVTWSEGTHQMTIEFNGKLEVDHLNDDLTLTQVAQVAWTHRTSPVWSVDGQYLYAQEQRTRTILTLDPTTLAVVHHYDYTKLVPPETAIGLVPVASGFLIGYYLVPSTIYSTTLSTNHFITFNAAATKVLSTYNAGGGDATSGGAWPEDNDVLIADNGDHYGLFKDAGLTDSVLTLVMGRPNRAGTATGHGTLTIGGAAAPARPLTLTITHGAQTDTVPLQTTSTGAFSFHRAVASGWTQFTVSFAATATESRATVGHRTRPRVVPYDFNGDGKADLVSSTPYATVAGHTGAGQITVLPGAAPGITTDGSQLLTQETAGVAGKAVTGTLFGYTTASGDLNGDGFADLVVSAPAYDSSSIGQVVELFGSAAGLTTKGSRLLSEDHSGRYPRPYVGAGVAVGDLDGDGYDDVMVGEPGADQVHVFAHASSHSGYLKHPDLHTDHVERPATSNWGTTLATGDVNGDGFDDLAIGAPSDANGLPFISGSVTVVNGSEHGWTTKRQITMNTPGVPSAPTKGVAGEYYDSFGGALSFGDLNGDGKDDLLVGSPGADVVVGSKRIRDAGAVYAFRGASSGLSLSGVRRFTQATSGVAGTPRRGDLWGDTVSTSDATGDHLAETAVGGADGLVIVFRGASIGLSASHAQWFNQDSPGIAGTSSASNGFGATLRFGDFTGDGKADLAVGAPGWNGGVGMLSVLYSGAHGLTGVGSTSLNPNSPGVPGTSHTKWYFGWLY